MKPSETDVPVRVNIWIRPECQKRQFDRIAEAKPSTLFLISDGGRNDDEWKKIRLNREYVESHIDWDCKVYKLYHDHNEGLYATGKQGHDLIWSNADYCILLEDDILPDVTYFRFCQEIFEKYRNDTRVSAITGLNLMGVYEPASSDWFFSRKVAISGFGMWKRTYEQFYSRDFGRDSYVMSLLKEETKKNEKKKKKILGYAENEFYEGHMAFSEFYTEFSAYGQHQLIVVPKRNLISNIGYGEGSAHAADLNRMPKAVRNTFNMKTYPMQFPMKEPEYLIPDPFYEKQFDRIMGRNDKLLQASRWLQFKWLYLKNGGNLAEGVRRVVNRHRNRKNEYES